jgi:threonine synthase
MPASSPTLPQEVLADLGRMTWPETASIVARHLFAGELDPDTTETLAHQAFDFPLHLIRLTERIVVLDLTRGPTLAFKDVGARFMARLMAHFRQGETDPLTILTATSGDTGGAVAHAFVGLPGIRVVVLFPDGKVSPRQERQFSTLGGNVQAVAIQSDFDDCQRMAKEAFRDSALRNSLSLTSANSINVGRFLPQSFYYFYAWAQIRGHPSFKQLPLLFSVPSGNFGNLAAGLMAKSMGLPSVSFLAATNGNDGVPKYLRTGHFRPRPSRRTLSTAMDVGDPSNLARILHLYAGDLIKLRGDLTGRSVSDEETKETIARIQDRFGYLLDPHSAVGFAALEMELGDPNSR